MPGGPFVRVKPNFLSAVTSIYGALPATALDAASWTPPSLLSGHHGRYLWTDAFGVIALLTLSHELRSSTHLILARRLIDTVHNVLGRTRDQSSRLPGATDEHPLKGGLRIGKIDETGSDADGQYFHYLVLWMFVLNRTTLASGDTKYNNMAIELAKAVHPRFVSASGCSVGTARRPRMYWKMSIDLSHPLVRSEGNLDPIDGYVVYSLLQETAGPTSNALESEIATYKQMLDTKWQHYVSSDPLDLGMTLWTAHWFAGKERWADVLCERTLICLHELQRETLYFQNSPRRRLAFREFGTCLGIRCIAAVSNATDPNDFYYDWDDEQADELEGLASGIVQTWEKEKIGSLGNGGCSTQKEDLKDINALMYTAALFPGAFQRDYFEPVLTTAHSPAVQLP